MDVDAVSYPHHLLGMLIAISEADFVSFDLELSGIPNRMPGKPRSQKRQTLDDRYLEAKAGAERYQILQVGFTCARFDYLTNKYVLRPYNVNISPIIDERLDIEREVTFQTGAVQFLLKNGFQFDLPFSQGVQYLSRDEAKLAKQMAYDRFDKKNVVEDLQLKETDVDSLDFVRRVREAILKWRASGNLSLRITTHTGLAEQPKLAVISRFEKRLVHQLVRAEFPDLVSISKPECIQIIDYDANREADNTRRLKNRVKEQIVTQTGFRWIVEALAGGNIDPIDPIYFARDPRGMVIAADLNNIRDRYSRAAMRLKHQQAVLVGHNMFTDLVYLYRTFIGELPETLQEFRVAIHELFPRIVDTKYLATYNGGDLNASPTLQEIAEGLETQELPGIATHADHPKYHELQAFHEAGFDSLLTATIMLRLSAKLGIEGQSNKIRDDASSEASFKTAVDGQEAALIDGREHVQAPVSLPAVDNPDASHSKSSRNSRKKKNKAINGGNGTVEKTAETRFATRNVFESLKLNSEDGNFEELEHGQEPPERSWQDEPIAMDESDLFQITPILRQPMEMIPDFDSDFWRTFGNKLRVFGTQETVLTIAEWEKRSSRQT